MSYELIPLEIDGKDDTMMRTINPTKDGAPVGVPLLQGRWTRSLASASVIALSCATFFAFSDVADAATTNVNLATAGTYAILAGTTITNTGSSVISGDIGLSPGTSMTGFPPGTQSSGTTHVADGNAASAQNDLTTAYNDAAARTPFTTVSADLGGTTLVPGVYNSSSSMSLTGALTLNGGGDLNSVFIFQMGSTLTSATSSSVVLENGAQACHVFWQVGSSATLGTTSNFAGSIMALTSVTLNTGAQVSGSVLARNGAVTLNDNAITVPSCQTSAIPTTTTTVTPTTSTTIAATTTTVPAITTSTTSTTTTVPATTTTVPATTTTVPATTTSTTSTTTTVAAPTTTTVAPTLIPVGPPATGFGGSAARSAATPSPLIWGSLVAAGTFGSLALLERRRSRRTLDDQTSNQSSRS